MNKVGRRAVLVAMLILLAGCFVGLGYNGYEAPSEEQTPTPEPTPSTPVATTTPTFIPTATPTPEPSGGDGTSTPVGTDFGDEGWSFEDHYHEQNGVGDHSDDDGVRIGGEGNVTGEQETVTPAE